MSYILDDNDFHMSSLATCIYHIKMSKNWKQREIPEAKLNALLDDEDLDLRLEPIDSHTYIIRSYDKAILAEVKNKQLIITPYNTDTHERKNRLGNYFPNTKR